MFKKLAINFLLLIVLAANSTGAVIKLFPEAQVSGTMVELGEIAKITTDVESEKRYLSRMPLFKIPEKKVLIQADEIKQLLLQKYRKDFVLIGDSISVEPLFTRILEFEVIEKIKSAVVKTYSKLSYDSLRIILLDPLPMITVPQGDIRVRVVIPGGPFHLPKLARLEIFTDDQLYISQPVKVKLMAYIKVALATRSLSKNQVLRSRDYKICAKMININPESYLINFQQASKIKLRCPIAKGKPILSHYLSN